jgi:UPF0271 protein
MTRIDLNCDLGEVPEAIADGTQESLMPSISSANIACGGHAGDAHTMQETIRQALRHNLAIGAHPGYPDRANFGRIELNLSPQKVSDFVFEQVRALADLAANLGARLTHVKPHGALYNQAVHDAELARAIADGVARHNPSLVLVGLAGSPMLDVFSKAGFRIAAEAFIDRLYEPDGTLRSRKFDDALIRDPAAAGRQAVDIALRHSLIARGGAAIPVAAQTMCIHGDSPGALQTAKAVAGALRQAGVDIAPFK